MRSVDDHAAGANPRGSLERRPGAARPLQERRVAESERDNTDASARANAGGRSHLAETTELDPIAERVTIELACTPVWIIVTPMVAVARASEARTDASASEKCTRRQRRSGITDVEGGRFNSPDWIPIRRWAVFNHRF